MKNIFTFTVLCKGMAGLKRKCQVYSGQSKKIRKVFLGQVNKQCLCKVANSACATLHTDIYR
ncbi:MAG: hypothetical protein LBH90_05040, partial [Tannerella sp.]|nr:hypothetical protein [Tannerella sp.]